MTSKTTNLDTSNPYGPQAYNQNGDPICGADTSIVGRRCNREPGWGTDHSGQGPCKNHGGTTSLSIISQSDSYAYVVENPRLRQLIEEEEARGQVDGLDAEIILLKGTIRFLAESMGKKVVWNKEEESLTVLEGVWGLDEQATAVVKTINILANTIKSKYQILTMARESIPREQVRAYISGIINVLDKNLRNTCSDCGAHHGTRDSIITMLDNMESL